MSVQQYWLFSSVECGVSRLGDWWSNMLYQVSVLIHYCCIIVWRTLPCCFDLRFDEFANFSLLRASWWFLIRMVNKSWLRFSHLYDYKHHQHHWLWGHWQCWFFFIIVFFTDLVLKVFFFATFLVIPLPVQVAQPVFFSLQSYCWCQYCWLLYSSALLAVARAVQAIIVTTTADGRWHWCQCQCRRWRGFNPQSPPHPSPRTSVIISDIPTHVITINGGRGLLKAPKSGARLMPTGRKSPYQTCRWIRPSYCTLLLNS